MTKRIYFRRLVQTHNCKALLTTYRRNLNIHNFDFSGD